MFLQALLRRNHIEHTGEEASTSKTPKVVQQKRLYAPWAVESECEINKLGIFKWLSHGCKTARITQGISQERSTHQVCHTIGKWGVFFLRFFCVITPQGEIKVWYLHTV